MMIELIHMSKKDFYSMNLNELYAQFTAEHEGLKISTSKFAKLRPRHCVLAGSSGRHNVCVCMNHENIKFMLNEINIHHLTVDTDMSLNNYHDCLDSIVCPESPSSCFLGECEICPGTAKLKENLRNSFDEHGIDEVSFNIWLQTDRCTLQTFVMDTNEFLDDFCKRLLKLKTYHFVSKMQSYFFKNPKENFLAGEFLICFNFTENYAFVVQNSAQSFH